MQNLVYHLLETNLEFIIANSYKNCHVQGLHSIMLHTNDVFGLRIYIAEPGSDLHDQEKLLSIHSHRRDLKLQTIKGVLLNHNYIKCITGSLFNSYSFNSAIVNDDEPSFIDKEELVRLHRNCVSYLTPGQTCVLPANQLHSVKCLHNTLTAWFVFEGKIDENYDPTCYNKVDPTTMLTDTLYQKLTEHEINNLITQIF